MIKAETITISGNILIKKGQPHIMRIEVEKTRRAYEIACRCGLFCVPKVLDYDDSTGTAQFEFILKLTD